MEEGDNIEKGKPFKDDELKKSQAHNFVFKTLILLVLTLQTSIMFTSTRYVQLKPKPKVFISSTGVVMTELIKLLACFLLVFVKDKGNVCKALKTIKSNTIDTPVEIVKVGFSSFLYVIQANLLYVAASNLDSSTTQVIYYQAKIFSTAIFSIMLLKKRISLTQWMALVLLMIGVVLLLSANGEEQIKPDGFVEDKLVGMASTLTGGVLSSLAGVCLEKMFKNVDVCIWVRNIQLGLLSLPFAIVTCAFTNWSDVESHGFFHNYDGLVVFIVLFSATNGLVIAIVLKHASSILQNFSSAFSIILSCCLQVYIFHYVIKSLEILLIGLSLVILSIFLYGKPNTGLKTPNDAESCVESIANVFRFKSRK